MGIYFCPTCGNVTYSTWDGPWRVLSGAEEDEARDAFVEQYKAKCMTAALREAMGLLGMTEPEYTQRLKAVLFPYPVITTSAGTNTPWLPH